MRHTLPFFNVPLLIHPICGSLVFLFDIIWVILVAPNNSLAATRAVDYSQALWAEAAGGGILWHLGPLHPGEFPSWAVESGPALEDACGCVCGCSYVYMCYH